MHVCRLLLLAIACAFAVCSAKAQQAAYVPVALANQSQSDPYAIMPGSLASGFGGDWILGGDPGSVQNAALLRNRKIRPLSNIFANRNVNPNRGWISAEWLLWDVDGMDVPPLVTSSPAGTPQNEAAFLGGTGTNVLFGNGELGGGTANGFRGNIGFWVTPQQTFAIEGEYFRLADQDDQFRGSSDGTTILGRPFFDIVAGRETAQLVSFPNLAAGSIAIDAETSLQSAIVNIRAALCPTHGNCNCQQQDRIDWILGYRYLQLEDQLDIRENITSLLPAAPGTIGLRDQFNTKNQFNGLQLGLIHRASFQRGYLESTLRVAVGNNDQEVLINGYTDITEAGLTDRFTGGLLAQRSNIGRFQRDEFMMIPEIGFKLGIQITPRLSATAGYSALYFPNVVRAGDQIDLDLNPNLVAPEVDPFAGPLRPRFRFNESDYWAHGLSLGGLLNF